MYLQFVFTQVLCDVLYDCFKSNVVNQCIRNYFLFESTLQNILCYMYLCSGCSAVGLDKSNYFSYVQVDGRRRTSKALLHMLFHILGRYHEHERPDREDYIQVIEENIIEGIYIDH